MKMPGGPMSTSATEARRAEEHRLALEEERLVKEKKAEERYLPFFRMEGETPSCIKMMHTTIFIKLFNKGHTKSINQKT
jgi:hypothetical protein